MFWLGAQQRSQWKLQKPPLNEQKMPRLMLGRQHWNIETCHRKDWVLVQWNSSLTEVHGELYWLTQTAWPTKKSTSVRPSETVKHAKEDLELWQNCTWPSSVRNRRCGTNSHQKTKDQHHDLVFSLNQQSLLAVLTVSKIQLKLALACHPTLCTDMTGCFQTCFKQLQMLTYSKLVLMSSVSTINSVWCRFLVFLMLIFLLGLKRIHRVPGYLVPRSTRTTR